VRAYLNYRDAGDHLRANFLVLEMIDQCVRRISDGELGCFYKQLRNQLMNESADMMDFVRERNGEDLHMCAQPSQRTVPKMRVVLPGLPSLILNRMQQLWLRTWMLGLPAASCSKRSRRQVLPRSSVAVQIPVHTPIFPATHWMSMPKAELAKGRSRCLWRRASPASHRIISRRPARRSA
jgi:hypothetical protein